MVEQRNHLPSEFGCSLQQLRTASDWRTYNAARYDIKSISFTYTALLYSTHVSFLARANQFCSVTIRYYWLRQERAISTAFLRHRNRKRQRRFGQKWTKLVFTEFTVAESLFTRWCAHIQRIAAKQSQSIGNCVRVEWWRQFQKFHYTRIVHVPADCRSYRWYWWQWWLLVRNFEFDLSLSGFRTEIFLFCFRFVCEQKPPHLRTPVMVELNSEEDSDVIIVETETEIKEEEVNSAEQLDATSSNSRQLLKPTTSRRQRNSSVSSENVRPEENSNDVPCATTTRRKRRQNMNVENRDDGDGPSRIKMVIRTDPQAPYASTVTTGALLADCHTATTSHGRSSFDGSGPSTSTSVIRQPFNPFKKKKYTVYDASSESSDSTDSSSSDSSHEALPKQKRLKKRPSQKTLKMHSNKKMFTKKLKLQLKLKEMMKCLQGSNENRGNISSSCSSTSSSSSDSSSMDEEEKESSSE